MLLVNRVYIQLLTHFMTLFFGFLIFSVGINRNQLHEMGCYDHILIASQLKLTNENIKKLYLIFYAIRLMAKLGNNFIMLNRIFTIDLLIIHKKLYLVEYRGVFRALLKSRRRI